MTTASVDDNPMNSSDRDYDDLTVIKGIGTARQQWLRESLGVHTFRDLAALSAEEIESRLKGEGRVASQSEIKGWIVQAQELAAADPMSQGVVKSANTEAGGEANSQNEEGESSPQVDESAGAETGGEANATSGKGKWKPFASFVVEFQARTVEGRAEGQRTKGHHMEADKGETWPGLEGEQLCRWMLAQATEKRKPEPKSEEPSVEVKPVITSAATVAISRIRAFQPPQAETAVAFGQAQQPIPGIIKGDEPFGLEVAFDLVGTTAVDLVKRHGSYQAQFYARNRSTGARLHLGDTQPEILVESKLAYTAVLPQATLPSGVYRLQALVMFQDLPIGPGFLEVPMLQVV